ncbi:MAG: phnA protein [Ardenticatenaceae bacterium]
MAKGYQRHQERVKAVSSFGRDLARRSGSCCELCGASGVKLVVFEVPPVPEEPEYERCIFICETCKGQIDKPKKMDPRHWLCLYSTIWSEVPAVQVMAVRLLRQLPASESWAADVLDQAYLEPETQEWADQVR